MNRPGSSADDILAALRSVQRQAFAVWLGAAVLGVIGVLALGLGVALLADAYLVLPGVMRLVLLLGTVAGVVAVIRWAWRSRPSDSPEDLARLVEQRHPELDNVLINTLQLSRSNDGDGMLPIISAIREEARRAIRGIRPTSAVRKRTLGATAAATALGIALLATYLTAGGEAVGRGLNRVLLPLADNTLTRIERIEPGDADVLTGSDVTITARLAGRIPSRGTLEAQLGDGRRMRITMKPKSAALPDRLTATVESLQQPLRYRVTAGDDRSRTYRVNVHKRPAAERITQIITAPEYLGAKQTQRSGGTVRALAGSTVKLRFHASQKLAEGSITLDSSGETKPLTIRKRSAASSPDNSADQKKDKAKAVATAQLRVTEPDRYSLKLVSVHGFASRQTRYQITPIPDEPPKVRLSRSDGQGPVDIDRQVQLDALAQDDHGVRDLKLLQLPPNSDGENSSGADDEKGGAKALTEPVEIASWTADGTGAKKLKRAHTIPVAELFARVGEDEPVRLRAVGRDRQPDGGVGRSEPLTLQLDRPEPTDETDESDSEKKISLDALIDKQKQNVRAGEALLAGNKDDAEPLADQVERQTAIRQEALAIARPDDVEEGESLPPLRKRLADLAETLMTTAIDQLSRAEQTGAARKLQAAVGTEKEILSRLVSANNEQSSDSGAKVSSAIMRMVSELLAKQKKLRKDTGEQAGSAGALSTRQRVLSRKVVFLRRRLRTEAEAGADGNAELAKLYRKAAGRIESDELRGTMLRAAQALSEQSFARAADRQDQAVALLAKIKKLLEKKALEDAKKELDRYLDDLNKARERLDKMVDVQKEITEKAKQLKKTKDLTEGRLSEPKDLQALEKARENMEKAVEKLSEDLHLMPEPVASNDLLREIAEVFEDVDQKEGSADNPVSETAVDRDEGLLNSMKQAQEEMGKRKEQMEQWLEDTPDSTAWQQEAGDKGEIGEVPLGDLPEALEDTVGEMLDQAEDLKQEAQDSAGNAGTPDMSPGWGIADGPIPSFGAQGKSGNQAPNKMEQTGRSGSGRQGMSNGEIVGDTVKALEGSEVEARRTNDAAQAGSLKEEDPGAMDAKATGGGKVAGTSQREGMTGDTPPRNELKYRKLRTKAERLENQAETVYSKANLLRMPTGELGRAVLEMNTAASRLTEGDLAAFQRAQQRVIRNLKQTKARLTGEQVVEQTDGGQDQPAIGATREPIPTEYEQSVAEYMRRIAEGQ